MTSMLAGMRRRSSLCASQTEAFKSSTVGSINCLRLNASNCRVNDAVFWVAPLLSAKPQRFALDFLLRHLVAVAHDDAQIVVELVGNSTCQMAHSFHLLSLTQFVFGALAHADVPQDHRVEPFRGGLHLRDRGFNRKFLPIGSDAHQRSRRVHRAAGGASLPEAPNVFPMSLMESLWDKLIDRLPDGLGCWAVEDLFCGSVKNNDPLLVIDRDDGIHRGTNYAEQSLLAISKGVVSPLVLRNILYRAFD